VRLGLLKAALARLPADLSVFVRVKAGGELAGCRVELGDQLGGFPGRPGRSNTLGQGHCLVRSLHRVFAYCFLTRMHSLR